MAAPHLVRISKLLALILRHRPGDFGVVLDAEGYAGLDEVLAAVASRIPGVTRADLAAVVSEVEPEKSRYHIEGDEIRANYGHSLPGRIEQAQGIPPAILWHGTPARALGEIARQGLLPMRRQYVHLTTDPTLAERIGARHGAPRLLKVDATRAHADGIAFYRANDAFWLCAHVPPGYVSV